MDIEMKIENENINKSLNNSLNIEQMNISNEENFTKNKSFNDSYNHTDNSYGDNYSTANSNVESSKNKLKQNLTKEKKENINSGKNQTKNENKMIISQDNLTADNINVQNVEEYMDDILESLIDEEKNNQYEINPNYFQYQKEINQSMRIILIDWLIEVHSQFNFKEETLYIAIYIMDSYLSKKYIQRKNFQLLGITSLLIASKLNEVYFRKIADYAFITANAYSIDHIKYMEEDITKTLDFNFLIPSALSFFEIISKKFGISEDLNKFRFGEFLIQSFLIDYRSLQFSYSTIACACCYIVMKFYKMKNYQICYNCKYYSIKNNNMDDNNKCIINYCVENICSVVSELFNLKNQSIFKKYSNCKFYEDIKKILGFCYN